MSDRAPLLATENLTKRFPGVVALDGVDLTLEKGEVLALCGENGAGKSTLIKLLSGVHLFGTYGGRILVDGREARFSRVADAEALGIAVIHQELQLVPSMTVYENIYLGDEPTQFGFVDTDRMIEGARSLLSQFGVEVSPEATLSELGVGAQQLVEIVKALRKESRVLILDEPTAALTEREVQVLLDIVVSLKGQGTSVVYISHKLDEVFAIADRIVVLRDGASVASSAKLETTPERVIAQMVGRDIVDLFPKELHSLGEVLLSVTDLTVKAPGTNVPRLSRLSFEVHAGEVLGIGGLMGAGRSELLLHLFGLWGSRLSGRCQIGNDVLARSPAGCISQGLVLLTEDRKRFGLVLEQGVGFNLSLSSLTDVCKLGFVDSSEESARNQASVERLGIKTPHLETAVNTLSGGNQQKVVLGKALLTKPRIILLDEPTRGIDVGAKQEIYRLMNQLTASGVGIVLVSSELPELMGMSDRILMLAEGRVGGEFKRGKFDQAELLGAAMARGTFEGGTPDLSKQVLP